MTAAAITLGVAIPALIYPLTRVGAALATDCHAKALIAACAAGMSTAAQEAIMPKWREAHDTFIASPIVSANKSSNRIQKNGGENSNTGLKISDMFLEIGSNVGLVARRDELGVAEIAVGRSATLRP